jgi:hypothetical protein
MKINWDCFGSGLFGAFMFAMVGGVLVGACEMVKKDGFDDGERAGRKATEDEFRKKYRDPASYPKGSCVQQAIECELKSGVPRVYLERSDEGSVGHAFYCEKTLVNP